MLRKAIIRLLVGWVFILFLPMDLWAQMEVEFNYENGGKTFTGSVLVDFSVISGNGANPFNFSQIPKLTHESVRPGQEKIIIKFQELKWVRLKHRKGVLRISAASSATPGLRKPNNGLELSNALRTQEMVYIIEGNGSGNIKLEFSVVSEDGTVSSNAKTLYKRYTIRNEEAAFNRAKRIHTIQAYNNFLVDYPEGEFARQARNAIRSLQVNTWDIARRKNSKAGYEQYLAAEPRGSHAGEAVYKLDSLDDRDWARARRQNTSQGYQSYINKWERGHRGAYLSDAKRFLRSPEPSNQTNNPAPAGPDADREAWDAAEAADTPEAYKGYLQAFPEGRFKSDALERIPIELVQTTRSPEGAYEMTFHFHTGNLSLESVQMELAQGEKMPEIQAGRQEIIRFKEGELNRFDYLDGMLIAEQTGKDDLRFSSEMARTFTVNLVDETGKKTTQKLEFGIAPLEISKFLEEGNDLSFDLSGGKPPYFLEIKKAGNEEVLERVSLGEDPHHELDKSTFQSKFNLKGTYEFVFSDVRRTEAVTQSNVVFEGQTYLRWLLMGAGLLVVGLLLFLSLRPKKNRRKY